MAEEQSNGESSETTYQAGSLKVGRIEILPKKRRKILPKTERLPDTDPNDDDLSEIDPFEDDDEVFDEAVTKTGLQSADEILEMCKSQRVRSVITESFKFADQRGTRQKRYTVGRIALLRGCLLHGAKRKTDSRSSTRWLHEWIQKNSTEPQKAASWAKPVNSFLPNPQNILFSQNAIRVIRIACELASRTINEDKFATRHLIAALLVNLEWRNATRLRDAAVSELGVDPVLFLPELLVRVTAKPALGEDTDEWESRLGGSVYSLTDFAADNPKAQISVAEGSPDPLNIHKDVRALARLMCLDAASTPLSIALFGSWGSGKSTFMARLEMAVLELIASEKRRPHGPGGRSPFVFNPVQIRFNAWHYSDANLWASLTSEFFAQLKVGGAHKQSAATYAALVDKVTTHVKGLDENAASLKAEAAKSQDAVWTAKRQRDDAARNVSRASGDALAQFIIETAYDSFSANRKFVDEVGKEAGTGNLSQDVDAFLGLLKLCEKPHGELQVIGKALFNSGWRSKIIILSGLTCLALGTTFGLQWLWGVMPGTVSLFLTGGGFLIGMASFATFATPAIKAATGFISKASSFAGKIKELDDETAKSLLEAEVHLKAEEAKAKSKNKALKAATDKVADYSMASADKIAASHILKYILEDSGASQDFDKETGIISRSRRFFEGLDAAVREERKRDPANRGAPDRIILYIDDLDRCSHDQVYNVLQAIHLLLSFELFVVVVGVDIRWVQEAILRHQPSSAEALDVQAENARRVRIAAEYLEKIFQVPFWLQPLDPKKSYRLYVQDLLKDNSAAIPLKVQTPKEDRQEPVASDRFEAVDAKAERVASTASRNETRSELLRTLTLTAVEVDLMSSEQIGAIASRNPRAVKRMINIYRLVRAHLSSRQVTEFVGTETAPGSFVLAQILIALEVGQSVEALSPIYNSFYARWRNIEYADRSTGNVFVEIEALLEKGKFSKSVAVVRMMSEVLDICPGAKDLSFSELGRQCEIVRRYSFNVWPQDNVGI